MLPQRAGLTKGPLQLPEIVQVSCSSNCPIVPASQVGTTETPHPAVPYDDVDMPVALSVDQSWI